MQAVVLLSGGMDSAVTLAMMRAQGLECVALSFDYGQRHRVELESAAAVARALGAAEHRVQRIDLRAFGKSALTDEIAVPKDRPDLVTGRVPVTYVPARNTIFLSMALALAESIGARDIALGANAIDYSGYPDCRPAFLEAFERMANLGTRAGTEAAACMPGARPFRIHAPLLRLTKAAIVRKGIELKVDFALTTSCYDPGPRGEPCRHCDACLLRAKGFEEVGVPDPRR